MASSKLWFSLLGSSSSSIVGRNIHKTPKLIYPVRSFPSSLHSVSYSGASVAEPSSPEALHPWPEWVTFVDRLKTKGYFSKTFLDKDDAISYTDSKILKDACLSFARHRFDVLKSLSLVDIQTVVEKGCPNLFRKVVNSAKRLRAHCKLDEAEVCGACDLRGSCDRSYLILTDDEASVRTVDVVRILLLYALDPSVLSGETTSSNRTIIETSARRLLSELIELSDTVPAPEVAITLPPRTKKDPTRDNIEPLNFDDGDYPENVEMRNGDWNCPRCNFMNFGRNIRCLKCQENCPKRFDSSVKMKKGDWNCPECGFMNFASKSNCFRCKESRPPRKLEPGAWECSSCSYMNFNGNSTCKKCNCDPPSGDDTLPLLKEDDEPPARKLEYGEWECPSCAYVNFRKNITCRKCNCDRPRSAGTLH